MAAGPDRTALLLPALRPTQRRAASLLLQDAARTGDGVALDAASGELLLLGVRADAADRVARALGDLGLPAGTPCSLAPEGGAPLLAWAERSAPAPRPDPGLAARLDAMVAGLPPEGLRVRRSVLRLGAGVAPRRLACHVTVSRRRLAAALGPAGMAEPDLLEEALALAETRLAADAWSGPVPPMLRPGKAGPPAPGAIALLPLAAAAAPARLGASAAALRGAGWAAVGLDGLDAAVLPLLDLAVLPPDGPLLLRWSPALAGRAAAQALRALPDPSRLVLTGCADAEAMGWGFEVGVRHFAGPAVEALIDAARTGPGTGNGPRPGA